ncbi:hypothetical protein HPB50_027521 [Hyalomma asiaticum]|uniref:Uncharacterized protein n=1 Tax=Hyalomma asiaticum TaxID=266040 RepID=A0ACB7STI1_HYAAI|nr:hypothetical protein HPB50_027521 [Hyalomma asiaticum]
MAFVIMTAQASQILEDTFDQERAGCIPSAASNKRKRAWTHFARILHASNGNPLYEERKKLPSHGVAVRHGPQTKEAASIEQPRPPSVADDDDEADEPRPISCVATMQ